jgi:hypothetical protein
MLDTCGSSAAPKRAGEISPNDGWLVVWMPPSGFVIQLCRDKQSWKNDGGEISMVSPDLFDFQY